MEMTILALFDSNAETQPTIDDLLATTAVQRDDIIIVSPNVDGRHRRDPLADADRSQLLTDAVRLGILLGACVGALLGLLSSLTGFTSLAMTLGPFLSALGGAVIGVLIGIAIASLLGGITTLGANDEAMHMYGEGLQPGATLVGVVVQDAAVHQVEEILRQHGAEHIQKRHGAWRRIHAQHV